jgi:hypothetical protein
MAVRKYKLRISNGFQIWDNFITSSTLLAVTHSLASTNIWKPITLTVNGEDAPGFFYLESGDGVSITVQERSRTSNIDGSSIGGAFQLADVFPWTISIGDGSPVNSNSPIPLSLTMEQNTDVVANLEPKDLSYEQVITSGSKSFTTRSYLGADGQGWFKLDPTHGWMTRSYVNQHDFGTSDSGWKVGPSWARSNQSYCWVNIPSEDNDLIYPIVNMQGGHWSEYWWTVWDYSGIYANVTNQLSDYGTIISNDNGFWAAQ